MVVHWAALAPVFDSITAACAGFNFLYFLGRLRSLDGLETDRLFAVAVLALISLAMMVGGLSRLSVALSGEYGEGAVLLPASAVSMLAAATVTAMLVRRMGR